MPEAEGGIGAMWTIQARTKVLPPPSSGITWAGRNGPNDGTSARDPPNRDTHLTHGPGGSSRLPFNRIELLPAGGVRIGATVRNSDLAADPTIRACYPALSQAVLAGRASGPLRERQAPIHERRGPKENRAWMTHAVAERVRCPASAS
jgi:hypothetical protein